MTSIYIFLKLYPVEKQISHYYTLSPTERNLGLFWIRTFDSLSLLSFTLNIDLNPNPDSASYS